MGIIPSRNLEEQRREENGVTYFDRGVIEGKDGRKYSRYAIQTHFVQVGESYIDLMNKYVVPIYQEGDILSMSEKVIAICQRRVVTEEQVKPGFWAKVLSRCVHQTAAGQR